MEVSCYNCGERGHFAEDCKQQRKARSPSPQAKGDSTFDMKLYECKVEPQNMLINVKINGILEKAIVDTAAQISVINIKLANPLTPPIHIGKEVTLMGIGKKRWLKANYSKDANIEIEGVQFKWPVIVADITDQVIIGLDILSADNALIDLHDKSVNIQGIQVKAEVLTAERNPVSVAGVLLKTKVRIPPHSSVHVVGKLDNTLEEVMV